MISTQTKARFFLGMGCISCTAQPLPILDVQPTNNDLGIIAMGDTQLVPLQISAQEGDIRILGVVVDNILGEACSFSEGLFTLTAGQSSAINIAFSPEIEGLHQCRITISANSQPKEIDVMLFAQVQAPQVNVFPTTFDFGAVDIGDSASKTIRISNEGTFAQSITSFYFDDAQFRVLETTPFSIEAGAESSITVSYEPTSLSPADTTLSLSTDVDVLSLISFTGNNCRQGLPSNYDTDEDGYTSCAGDCDDSNPEVSPRNLEICDGLDNNCDGRIDEDTECYDDDGDGFSENEGDCNDFSQLIHPAQQDIAGNGIDDNCDGIIDDESIDLDGDGYSTIAGDCDDTHAEMYPDNIEVADNLDNDCDGIIDEDTVEFDDDGDGYSENEGDCDDNNANITPNTQETINGIDDNCDGTVDEGTSVNDDDGDGYSENGGDCDDNNATINPSAAEQIGNNRDDDCDGIVE